MKEIKCAVFDLDGTILDSMDVWAEIDIEFLSARNLKFESGYLDAIAPMGFKAAAEYTVSYYSLNENPEDIIKEWNRMAINAYSHKVGLKPFAKEFLIYLKKKGIKLSVATASDESLYAPALINNGIYGLFDTFTLVSEVSKSKSHPDIYLKAADKSGFGPDNTVVFEDIYEGIAGAKKGGFYTIAVYEKHSLRDSDRIKALADRYIYSFEELMDL